MPAYYPYLIASLPMLKFGEMPPFSFGAFIEKCSGLIPDADIELLNASLMPPRYFYKSGSETERRYRQFDAALRNELVRIRAARKKIAPLKYLRQDAPLLPHLAHTAMAAQRNPSILEGERLLDRARWDFLEELAAGHYFDSAALLVYAHKLIILQKWGEAAAADKARLLGETLETIMRPVSA